MGLLANHWITDLVYVSIIVATAFYLFCRRTYSYWERHGFKSISNVNYLVGSFKSTFTQEKSFSNFILDIYRQTKEPLIGLYGPFRPILLVRDPELIRTILVKDFNNFTDRGLFSSDNQPLTGTLFNLRGQKWRNLRGMLSPTFTSGKLKSMFSTLVASGGTLQKHLEKLAESHESVEVRDLAARYTTNNISSIGFGIEVDTIADPNNDFRKYGKIFFQSNYKNALRGIINFTAPKLMSYVPLRAINPEVEEFIFSIVKQNLEYREKNNVSRKDFFQLLIQLRNTGTVQLDDQWETVIQGNENQKSMTLNEIAAQVFVFYAAGFETSAITLSYCLLELAKQPDIQKRVQWEIDQMLANHDGQITYDSISEMKLLDHCIDETLRMYPVVPVLNRTCINNYKIPETKNILEKGIEVFIPVIALHHDETFYPNPEKFIPERFNEEGSAGKNQSNRPYLPFGDGPRNCIGMRLGKLQTKVGLTMMLQKFEFELVSKDDHRNVYDFDKKAFFTSPNGGIHLYVNKRQIK